MDERLKRAIYLLMVTNNLLNKQNQSPFVLNILEETVEYDGTECDGNCLMDDIQMLLSEFGIESKEDFYNVEYDIPESCTEVEIDEKRRFG